MKHHSRERDPGSRRIDGFTIVELLVVILIITILMSLVLGISGYATKKASLSKVQADLENIKTALEEYRVDYGTYPQGSGEFELVVDPEVMKKYVNDIEYTDPWGRPYEYESAQKYSFVASSKGPDKNDDSDDISTKIGAFSARSANDMAPTN